MRKLFITTICFLAASLCIAQSGSFSNITVSQRTDGSGFVDVYFTLSGPGAAYDLSLEVRFHSDSAYIPIPEEFLTGSFISITPGSRSLVWDGLGSFPGTYSPDAKLKLIAVETEPCPETITDFDGNIYNTVFIDNQCWMTENLKTTKYRDGSSIEYPGGDNSAWSTNMTGAYAWYDNNIAMKDAYGALYNWPAAKNPKGICPAGWHIPSNAEWTHLVDYLVGQGYPDQWNNPNGAGNALKSCRQVGSPLGGDCNTTEHPRWNAHATHHGFDVFGFSALPGGYRSNGPYYNIGYRGNWWSSTEEYDLGSGFFLYNNESGTSLHPDFSSYEGFSVRCMRSGPTVGLPTVITNPVTNITATTATSGGNVAGDGGAAITARGVVWSTSVNPTLESNDGVTTDGEGTGEFSSEITGLMAQTTYYVRAYGTNSAGTGYGNQVQFTTGDFICETSILYDIDGNAYNTVQIGDQCWMKENLKTTQYRDGTPIENPTGDSDWQNNTTGAYAWYDNNSNWKDSYGALYNWFAVNNANGICPSGWHIPSADEWAQLTDFTGGTSSPNGNKLKSCRQVGSPLGGDCSTSEHPRWDSHSFYGTDDYGFSAFPAGTRWPSGGFYHLGRNAYWWISNEHSSTNAWARYVFYNNDVITSQNYSKPHGFSVRCLKNAPPASDFSGTPTSGSFPLTVSFSDLSTNMPTSWQWNFGDGNTSTVKNPAHVYNTPGAYTVSLTAINQNGNSTTTKTDYIIVEPYCPPTITDIDDNTYNTVQIGAQCWMKENLKTIHYRNGTPIEYPGEDNNAWENNANGAFAWHGNDISWKNIYGALYNWYAVNNANGLCPTGWYVPTASQWAQFIDYIVDQGYPNQMGNPNGAGNALKSCRQIDSPLGGECNTSEHPRWRANEIHHGFDTFNFSAFPAGRRYTQGHFDQPGDASVWWAANQSSAEGAWVRAINWDDGRAYLGWDYKVRGYPIRCIKY